MKVFSLFKNEEHCEYLLTALYFESLKVEEWEFLATESDRAEFAYEDSLGEERMMSEGHRHTMQAIMNLGETKEALEGYKEAVKQAMGLKPL
jgi:hypothetical protein